MVAMFFMPESPRYALAATHKSDSHANINSFDIAHGKAERGRKTLANFRGDGDINHPAVIDEYDEIVAAVGTSHFSDQHQLNRH